MSKHYCAACRAAPASIFCSADAAFLCDLCDVAVHEANKLARRHTRLPLHLIDNLGGQLAPPAPPAPKHQEKTSSCETGFDESDASSGFLVVPDTDDMATLPVSPYAINQPQQLKPFHKEEDVSWGDAQPWCPPVQFNEEERLASIAGAFVKKEAHTLLQSSRGQSVDSDYVQGLPMFSVGESTPQVDANVYSSAAHHVNDDAEVPYYDHHFGQGPAFGFQDDHEQTHDGHLHTSLSTEDNSSVPGEEAPNDLKPSEGPIDQFERTDEQKRQDRQAALRRFRSKRANRSFRKKVRYECRKQLADSRPRVKGRFVGRSKTGPSSRIQKSGITQVAG